MILFLGAGLIPAGAFIPALPLINTNNVITVTNAPFNALGDGIFTNTAAIQSAIHAAGAGGTVNGLSGGTVRLPGPGTYLCGSLYLTNNVNLQVDDGAKLLMLPFAKFPFVYITNITATTTNVLTIGTNFINGKNLHDISITGSGTIDGQGLPWWPYANSNNFTRAIMLSLSSCTRELIQNITLSNSPEFHIAIGGSASESTVDHVTVLANPSSDPVNPGHNTDACDVSGTDILVKNCYISVGDDNFTCGGGTANIMITNNTYGFGHGVSIGSFTSPSVSNMTVVNCTFNNTEQGIRIKTDRDRGGLVQKLNYYNLSMTNVLRPILIYTEYTNTTPAYRAVDSISPAVAASYTGAAISSKTPYYRDITFSNITATTQSGHAAGLIWGLPESPVTNITMVNVHITADRTFGFYYAKGVVLNNVQIITPSSVPAVSFYNADITVTNPLPTANVVTMDGLTTNGIGNLLTLVNGNVWLSNTNAIDITPLNIASSTLTISNHFNFSAAKTANFTLGTNATTIAVLSNLFLGGTINVKAGDGFTNATYTLFTYKNLAMGTPGLGSMPNGFAGTLDTATSGQVKLVVQTQILAMPAAPTNVVAVGSNAMVLLSWSPAFTALGYKVKRSPTDGGPYLTVFSGISLTGYTDTLVMNGTTYYYIVTATNSVGESTNSSQVSATPIAPVINSGGYIFNDTFSFGSTVNSASPAAPNVSSTAYQILSSKSWSPSPSISSGHLIFGISTTTSGSIEMQALFTNSPASLNNIGDSLTLIVTFTDTSGILTQSGLFGLGLYNSGGNRPVPGGLNSTATLGDNDHGSGNAVSWSGYVGQVVFTGANSRIMTRPPQGNGANNLQDLVTSGSGSSSYTNPVAATIDFQNIGGVTLTAGAQYTEALNVTLSAANTLTITNTLYQGSETNGTVVTRFGGHASGSTYLTNSFDGLAVGWRATASTSASTFDINQIKVDYATASTVTQPSLTPMDIVPKIIGNQLQLSWPSTNIGWTLQIQTNDLSSGLGTNWQPIINSTTTNQITIPIDPANGSVFLRMIYP